MKSKSKPSGASKKKAATKPDKPAAIEQMPMMSEELWPAIAGVLGLETDIRLKSATIKLELGRPVLVTVTQEALSDAGSS